MNLIQSIGNMVNSTPGAGHLHRWASGAASTSVSARRLLNIVVIFSLVMVTVAIIAGIVFILKGKLDNVAGTFLGGVIVFFGGVLAITLPAFAKQLDNTNGVTPGNPPAVQ
jgi:uncharacterized membrane protein